MFSIAHTSDVHLSNDDHYAAESLRQLRRVIAAAEDAGAALLLLAGDTFDHNRVALPFVEQVAAILAEASLRVVALPGNHDPLTDEGVLRWAILAALPNVQVLGLPSDRRIFPELGLELWGRAHRDYGDMDPLQGAPGRSMRWQVIVAHGHFHGPRPAPPPPHASWLIFSEDIDRTGADYIALGHWNINQQVGQGRVSASYSGSPDIANSINLVSFSKTSVHVVRQPLDAP